MTEFGRILEKHTIEDVPQVQGTYCATAMPPHDKIIPEHLNFL